MSGVSEQVQPIGLVGKGMKIFAQAHFSLAGELLSFSFGTDSSNIAYQVDQWGVDCYGTPDDPLLEECLVRLTQVQRISRSLSDKTVLNMADLLTLKKYGLNASQVNFQLNSQSLTSVFTIAAPSLLLEQINLTQQRLREVISKGAVTGGEIAWREKIGELTGSVRKLLGVMQDQLVCTSARQSSDQSLTPIVSVKAQNPKVALYTYYLTVE